MIYLAIDEIRQDETEIAAQYHANFEGGLVSSALLINHSDELLESELLKRAHVQAGEEL